MFQPFLSSFIASLNSFGWFLALIIGMLGLFKWMAIDLTTLKDIVLVVALVVMSLKKG